VKGEKSMSVRYGFSFDKDSCIQCHGCEVACKVWRNVETNVKWRWVENIWKKSYPDAENYSASIACLHCVEPLCVEACPVEAISKRGKDGIVVADRETCIGCKACLDACPYHVPAFGTDDKMQKCDMCHGIIDINTQNPPCVISCPTGALAFGKLT
jgi:anaerobic dimethyl sulfoxide reductase subunit B (iron-sulfur subunit)